MFENDFVFAVFKIPTNDVEDNGNAAISHMPEIQCSSCQLLLIRQHVLKTSTIRFQSVLCRDKEKHASFIKIHFKEAELHLVIGICCLFAVLVGIILQRTGL